MNQMFVGRPKLFFLLMLNVTLQAIFGGLSKFHAYVYFYGPGCEKKMNYIIISLTQ